MDGRLNEVPESRLEVIFLTHPNARIEDRDGYRVVIIPEYDIARDVSWETTLKIVPDPKPTKFGILPTFNVRTGATFNPKGDAHVSPLGKLYRIIGITPPPKDDEK